MNTTRLKDARIHDLLTVLYSRQKDAEGRIHIYDHEALELQVALEELEEHRKHERIS